MAIKKRYRAACTSFCDVSVTKASGTGIGFRLNIADVLCFHPVISMKAGERHG